MLLQPARLTRMKPRDRTRTRHCLRGETPAQRRLKKCTTFNPIFSIFVQPFLQTGEKQRLKKGLKHPKQENKKKQGFNPPTTRNLFPKSQKRRRNSPKAIQKTPKNGRGPFINPRPTLDSREHRTEPAEEGCCSFEEERSSTLLNRASLRTFYRPTNRRM